jgi:DNA mismatch endonuclease (patch repair protein)
VQPDDPLWPKPTSPATAAIMRSNRWRDTRPEVALRSELHRRGMRFRTRYTIRLGERRWTQPDVVFTRVRLVVFVDGCFWHSCPEHASQPKANSHYWEPKLARNVARDRDTDERLRALGWRVLRAWEHEDHVGVADRVQIHVGLALASA